MNKSPIAIGCNLSLIALVCIALIGCKKKSDRLEESRLDFQESQDNSAPQNAGPPLPPENVVTRQRERPTLSDMVEQIDGAIVEIVAEDALGRVIETGNGSVVTADGLIATSFHVLDLAADGYALFPGDDQHYRIKGYRSSASTYGLVIIELEFVPDSFEHFELRLFDVAPGQDVFVLEPQRQTDVSVAESVVSDIRVASEISYLAQEGYELDPFSAWIELSASNSIGATGSPLVSAYGELVGVQTAFAQRLELNFAVHAQHLRELLTQLNDEAAELPLTEGAASSRELLESIERFGQQQQQISEHVNSVPSTESSAEHFQLLFEHLTQAESDDERVHIILAACEHLELSDKESDQALSLIFATVEELLLDHPYCEKILNSFTELELNDDLNKFLRRVGSASHLPLTRGTAYLVLNELYLSKAGDDGFVAERIYLLERAIESLWLVNSSDAIQIQQQAMQDVQLLRNRTEGRELRLFRNLSLDLEPLDMKEDLGKVILIDFFDSASTQAEQLLSSRRELIEKLDDNLFECYIVSQGTPDQVQQLINQTGFPGKVYHPTASSFLREQWSVGNESESLILGADGRIYAVNPDSEDVELLVESLMELKDGGLQEDVIAKVSSWLYWANTESPGEKWPELEFDDNSWHSGITPIGFGLKSCMTLLQDEVSDTNPVTTYYRRYFDLADLESIDQLYMSIACNQGAAVYINGIEVLRQHLSGFASHEEVANANAPRDARFGMSCLIEKSILIEGKNVIAVEVHVTDRYSVESTFEISIGSTLDFPWNSTNPFTVVEVCKFLIGLGYVPNEHLAKVEEWASHSPHPEVRVFAQLLKIQFQDGGLHESVPDTIDAQEDSLRVQIANQVRHSQSYVVRSADHSHGQFSKAERLLRGALALAPGDRELIEYYAMALYRVGKYRECIQQLHRSRDSQSERAMSLCILVLANHQLQEESARDEVLARLNDLVDSNNILEDKEISQVYQEVMATVD